MNYHGGKKVVTKSKVIFSGMLIFIVLVFSVYFFWFEMYEKTVTREEGAQHMMSSLSELLENYMLENKMYPSNEQGLDQLRKLKQNKFNNLTILLNDPWGKMFKYELLSIGNGYCYVVWSVHLGRSEGVTNCKK